MRVNPSNQAPPRAAPIDTATCGARCWKRASSWRARAGPRRWCCARPRGAPAWCPTRPTGISRAGRRCCRRCAWPPWRPWPTAMEKPSWRPAPPAAMPPTPRARSVRADRRRLPAFRPGGDRPVPHRLRRRRSDVEDAPDRGQGRHERPQSLRAAGRRARSAGRRRRAAAGAPPRRRIPGLVGGARPGPADHRRAAARRAARRRPRRWASACWTWWKRACESLGPSPHGIIPRCESASPRCRAPATTSSCWTKPAARSA